MLGKSQGQPHTQGLISVWAEMTPRYEVRPGFIWKNYTHQYHALILLFTLG